ncbi:hypothetical protein SAMN04488057_105139 [Cyclobacterium lianum]|uniref:Uncharacterized protein n=1 Tax=Cyclobacterium lianum TaxID=388280 RepID=A0A1M7N906_9BACT|nr:hypothetical protein SAMN04488057_105139 [Cyclobacterium lianum]
MDGISGIGSERLIEGFPKLDAFHIPPKLLQFAGILWQAVAITSQRKRSLVCFTVVNIGHIRK